MSPRKPGESLRWSETDITECVEAVPETDEYKTQYRYRFARGAFRGQLVIEPYSGDVYLDVWVDDAKLPFFHDSTP